MLSTASASHARRRPASRSLVREFTASPKKSSAVSTWGSAGGAEHPDAQPLELVLRERRAQLGGEHVRLARKPVDRLAQVPPQRHVEIALERAPRAGRGEIVRILEADDRGAPMRDLPRDLRPDSCGLVNQSGTPPPTGRRAWGRP